MATFLICENIDFDAAKDIDTLFANIYTGIDKALYHNMILCLDDCCCLYNDGERSAYYPYYDYTKPTFKAEIVLPHERGYNNEHILHFLNYFFMIISMVSVLDIEITKYLGSGRIKKVLIEK